MRLLHTTHWKLESFPTPSRPQVPPYVILSHRWDEREISFLEMETIDEHHELKESKSFDKIKNCCKQAAEVGFEYAWIDTCCINKTDDAELAEALSSMYNWYRGSQVCYAYLSDVLSSENPESEGSSFRKSRWFTRGWTLQELLAPLHVTFFGADWTEIGTKSSLRAVITELTRIDHRTLLVNVTENISVAQRMSWAADRETAVPEDRAYSLMGLFGITNMRMRYGEGNNAFRRLQLEILKTSDDQSIFAWRSAHNHHKRGLLAESPSEFAGCGDIRHYGADSDTSAYGMTNKGLRLELPLLERDKETGSFLGVLTCQRKRGDVYPDRYPLGIALQRTGGTQSTLFERHPSNTLVEVREPVDFNVRREIYVKERDPSRLNLAQWMTVEEGYTLVVRSPPPGEPIIEPSPNMRWNVSRSQIRLSMEHSGDSGMMILVRDSEKAAPRQYVIVVMMGVHNYNVWSEIDLDYEYGDVDRIVDDYWERGSKRMVRWNNRDRITKRISTGDAGNEGNWNVAGAEEVSMAIRKGLEKVEGREHKIYFIDLKVPVGFRLEKLTSGSPKQNEYNF